MLHNIFALFNLMKTPQKTDVSISAASALSCFFSADSCFSYRKLQNISWLNKKIHPQHGCIFENTGNCRNPVYFNWYDTLEGIYYKTPISKSIPINSIDVIHHFDKPNREIFYKIWQKRTLPSINLLHYIRLQNKNQWHCEKFMEFYGKVWVHLFALQNEPGLLLHVYSAGSFLKTFLVLTAMISDTTPENKITACSHPWQTSNRTP